MSSRAIQQGLPLFLHATAHFERQSYKKFLIHASFYANYYKIYEFYIKLLTQHNFSGQKAKLMYIVGVTDILSSHPAL